MKLDDTDIGALKFLTKGPDTMGPISNENELAAAFVFSELERIGYVTHKLDGDNVIWTITDIGIEALL
jgi:hypothetical protein